MRGTGTTTQQLKSAPPGSLFIWCARHTDYPKKLCQRLNRHDIFVKGVDYLDRIDAMDCRRYSTVIVDHAVEGTPERHRAVALLMHMSKERDDAVIDLQESLARHFQAASEQPK